MNRLVVDSWAWVEYLGGSKMGEAVEKKISGRVELWTSVLSLTEVVSRCRRKGIPEDKALEAIGSLSRLGIPDQRDAAEAGRLHAQVRANSPNFSLADAFVLQLARKLRAKVLTLDPDFKGIKEAESPA
jgi:predicted nucleic acid-binding protein